MTMDTGKYRYKITYKSFDGYGLRWNYFVKYKKKGFKHIFDDWIPLSNFTESKFNALKIIVKNIQKNKNK